MVTNGLQVPVCPAPVCGDLPYLPEVTTMSNFAHHSLAFKHFNHYIYTTCVALLACLVLVLRQCCVHDILLLSLPGHIVRLHSWGSCSAGCGHMTEYCPVGYGWK